MHRLQTELKTGLEDHYSDVLVFICESPDLQSLIQLMCLELGENPQDLSSRPCFVL